MPFFGMKLQADGKAVAPKIPAGAVLTIKRISLSESSKDSSKAVVETVDPKNTKVGTHASLLN